MSVFLAVRDRIDDAIELDGATQVRTDESWLVTEYPVADAVSDHSQRRPIRYVLDVVLTETPPDGTERDPDRVQTAIEWLRSHAGILLDVEVGTQREPIRSVMIEGTPRVYTTTRAVTMNLALREVVIVRAQSIDLPAIPPRPKRSAASGRAKETNDGEQAPVAAENDRIPSWLRAGSDLAGFTGN